MIIGIDSMVLIYAEIVPSKAVARSKDFPDLRDRSKLLIYARPTGRIRLFCLPS